MVEPSSSITAALVTLFGAGIAGFLAGVDTGAVIGAMGGALVYISTTKELPLLNRTIFFIVSFVVGYMSAPAIAQAEVFGIGPIEVTGVGAFVSAALVVTATLAAIRSRSGDTRRQSDG